MTARPPGESDDRETTAIQERVARLYEQHGSQLRRFLWGVLRDDGLAGDCVQATFVKMIESGGPDREEADKAWLFRVAYHQALAIRRREAVGQRANRRLADVLPREAGAADLPAVARERKESVRKAIRGLPDEQRQIVRKRIYEEKTFAEIAEELNIPLGTALSRMRAALKRLRTALEDM